jgi:protein PhnA
MTTGYGSTSQVTVTCPQWHCAILVIARFLSRNPHCRPATVIEQESAAFAPHWSTDPYVAIGSRSKETPNVSRDDEDYVYDEASGEWMPASELASKLASENAVEVRDAVGNLLADGDQVTLIKDLTVKGAGQVLKQGTLIKSIRLTGDPQEIDCRYPGIKGLVLRAEFVRKR